MGRERGKEWQRETGGSGKGKGLLGTGLGVHFPKGSAKCTAEFTKCSAERHKIHIDIYIPVCYNVVCNDVRIFRMHREFVG